MMLISTLKAVFNLKYVTAAFCIFVGMVMLLSFLSAYVFFEPYFVFYIPAERLIGFLLVIAVSALLAIVLPMNIYLLKLVRKTKKAGGSIMGSILGVSAGACSCGPVGFSIISAFGSSGGLVVSFISTYEIQLRIVSLVILGIAYYSITKTISSKCRYI